MGKFFWVGPLSGTLGYFGHISGSYLSQNTKRPRLSTQLTELRRLALLSSLSDARIGSKHDFSRPFGARYEHPPGYPMLGILGTFRVRTRFKTRQDQGYRLSSVSCIDCHHFGASCCPTSHGINDNRSTTHAPAAVCVCMHIGLSSAGPYSRNIQLWVLKWVHMHPRRHLQLPGYTSYNPLEVSGRSDAWFSR